MENKDLTTPSAFWDSEDWNKYEYQIKERQNMMSSLGMVKLFCRVFSHDPQYTIKEEAILGCIALLLGGNEKSQFKFCRYIQKDGENIFLMKIKEAIYQCFDLIKRTEVKRNMLMQKHHSISNKIEEMIELLGDPEG